MSWFTGSRAKEVCMQAMGQNSILDNFRRFYGYGYEKKKEYNLSNILLHSREDKSITSSWF